MHYPDRRALSGESQPRGSHAADPVAVRNRKEWGTRSVLIQRMELQPIWRHRLQEGGNLWGTLPQRYAVYPDLLEAAGVESAEQETVRQAQTAELQKALNRLKPRLREVLERRFGLGDMPPETLEEVGLSLGITRERVRQLESTALRELQKHSPHLRHHLEDV